MTANNDEIDINQFTPEGVDPIATDPPEPVVEAVTEEPEAVEETDDPEVVGEAAEPPKKGRTTADRIKKLDGERNQYRREAEELRERVKALESPTPLTQPEKPVITQASEAPDPEKYQYGELDPQFMRDTARHEAKLELASFRETLRLENEATQQAQAAQREVAALQETAKKIGVDGAARFNDFQEAVLAADLASFSVEAFQAISDSPAAADVIYHLATNPDDAEMVLALPAVQQTKWALRKAIEMELKTPAPKRVSSAPPPITPARGSSGQFKPDPATQDFAAFERMALKG